MLRVLMDKLERKMKGTDADGMIKDIFAGQVKSFIKCIHVPFESSREEEFYDIQVSIYVIINKIFCFMCLVSLFFFFMYVY